MFTETANLILRHSDISTDITLTSASNSSGSYWSNGKQTTTFRVNLRQLLGNMWEKYDTFCIRLNQHSFSSANFPAVTNTDNQLLFFMSGLSFVNCTYNVVTGTNTNRYCFYQANIPSSTTQTVTLSPNVSIGNFKKTNEWVDITIELIRAIDGTSAQFGASAKFPHMVYSFDIYGIY